MRRVGGGGRRMVGSSAVRADRRASRQAPRGWRGRIAMGTSILERIQADMVKAMKAKEAAALSTLRMLKAALMEAKTAKPKDVTLSPEEEIEVLQRYMKKRRETIEVNTRAGRADLVPAEEAE